MSVSVSVCVSVSVSVVVSVSVPVAPGVYAYFMRGSEKREKERVCE